MTHECIQEIPLAKIKNDNIRDQINREALKGLAASIKAVGQLYPIRVRPDGENFVIVDGHRRAAARRLLGKATVLGIVEGESMSEAAAVQRALIANAQREGLTPLAMAKATAHLMNETGWNASQTASQLGFPASKITKLLSFLKLPVELAEQLSANGAGASVAYQLARIQDPKQQASMSQQFLNGQITRDAIGGELKRAAESPVKSKAKTRTSIVLGAGHSLSISGTALSLEMVIALLEEALAKARKARTKGWQLGTFVRALRDQAKERQK